MQNHRNLLSIIIATAYVILTLLLGNTAYAQPISATIKTYHPKDQGNFEKAHPDFDFDYESANFGKTTKIVYTLGRSGEYFFVLKKKILSTQRTSHYDNFAVAEILNPKSQTWEYHQDSWEHPTPKTSPNQIITTTTHNLYAFILLSDHGGYVEKARFQVFGNEIYWPAFDYPNCFVADEDKNGLPEFYLTFTGASDGLDAKPFSQIIYTLEGNKIIRSKATSYLPAGNPEDEHREEFDQNWRNLPPQIKKRSRSILKGVQPPRSRDCPLC